MDPIPLSTDLSADREFFPVLRGLILSFLRRPHLPRHRILLSQMGLCFQETDLRPTIQTTDPKTDLIEWRRMRRFETGTATPPRLP